MKRVPRNVPASPPLQGPGCASISCLPGGTPSVCMNGDLNPAPRGPPSVRLTSYFPHDALLFSVSGLGQWVTLWGVSLPIRLTSGRVSNMCPFSSHQGWGWLQIRILLSPHDAWG